jgi:hypothetical protein
LNQSTEVVAVVAALPPSTTTGSFWTVNGERGTDTLDVIDRNFAIAIVAISAKSQQRIFISALGTQHF